MSLPPLDSFSMAVLIRLSYQSSLSSSVFDTRRASSFDRAVVRMIFLLLFKLAIIKLALPPALAAQSGLGFGLTGETGIAARLLALDRLEPCLLLPARGAFVGAGLARRATARKAQRSHPDHK